MKILLTNNSLMNYAGTEMWVKTMADELSKEHKIYIYTHEGVNKICPEYEKYDLQPIDLAIVNHNTCLSCVKHIHARKIIYTQHGPQHHLEQVRSGADYYVAVSEEVSGIMKKHGFENTVIRNPINTDRFVEKKPTNDKLTNILYSTNYIDIDNIVISACREYNLKKIGGNNSVSAIEDEYNWADLVITIGRGVYEALSCNRSVLIYGHHGADGLVNQDNIDLYRRFNCSGRCLHKFYTTERLKKELENYKPIKMRDYVLKNNNSTEIAKQYLSLIN